MDTHPLTVARSGYDLLVDPLLNKGTAFDAAERDDFQLHGLLPPHIGTLDDQIDHALQGLRGLPSDLDRHGALRELRDINETLYYALLEQNFEEFLPIFSVPIVAQGCKHFSRLYRRPRGLYLSHPNRNKIGHILSQTRFDNIETIVVTDGERILWIGDQGANGMGVPIDKLALYTACAGLHPATTLPILLDTGTNNHDCLRDPSYIGWRHERVRGAAYDDFIETFLGAVTARWTHVLLQWEDFSRNNANRLLARYRDRLCTFNDDIQGFAACVTGMLLSALQVTGARLTDQRIAVLGAGGAGCGIATLLSAAMTDAGLSARDARRKVFLIDREGLLVEGKGHALPFQAPFIQSPDVVSDWKLENPGRISMDDVIRNARPSVLIGTSGEAGAFTESMVRAMARDVERPIIFPLSNPAAHSEASPSDLLAWSNGRAMIGTGSFSEPVIWNGQRIRVAQANSAYIFPGMGLGLVAARVRYVSDAMVLQAAKALAACSPNRRDPSASLLPPIAALPNMSLPVALAVARQAREEGLTDLQSDDQLEAAIRGRIWTPRYRRYQRAGE